MPEWAIAVTIVAAGTSAPELVTSLNAAVKGKFGISAGNLIGSDLFNLLGVLGLAAVIRPLSIDPAGKGSLHVLVIMVCVVVFFMRTGWKIRRWEGALLVGANLVRWYFDMSGKH
jgi:cation:H+ antiporter